MELYINVNAIQNSFSHTQSFLNLGSTTLVHIKQGALIYFHRRIYYLYVFINHPSLLGFLNRIYNVIKDTAACLDIQVLPLTY